MKLHEKALLVISPAVCKLASAFGWWRARATVGCLRGHAANRSLPLDRPQRNPDIRGVPVRHRARRHAGVRGQVEVVDWDRTEKVTEDGGASPAVAHSRTRAVAAGVTKVVLRAGEGTNRPNDGASCVVKYVTLSPDGLVTENKHEHERECARTSWLQ